MVEMVRKSGLDTAISAALAPWRRPRAVHDPGKILLDVALAVRAFRDPLVDEAGGVLGPGDRRQFRVVPAPTGRPGCAVSDRPRRPR
ncbi:hypothetical protein SSPO_097440 [Streptomyces antimycoticus]|uniref:Transposase DDE domain-containing protein n=1 Tax=Streptomyces antimycoticus TaxID=68175 RepID=A0A499VFQ4_9ACTN|nr:hypothetical protein SSPO_097440 [Streptomyces antimycoticus]